jgi:D-psicose/D-tagatose/L-ribulose 3-epimerase
MLLGCIIKDAAEVPHTPDLPVDYLELKGDLLCADTATRRALGERLHQTGLPCAAMTSPLPRRFGCRVVGPDADHTRALHVFRDMCDRAAPFGVRTVVLGSGQARSAPGGFPVERAHTQLLEFMASSAALCNERGMTLTLEPLATIETNLVNSCVQARALVDQLRGAGVGIAVDYYHLLTEGLSVPDEVTAATGAIGHAHTSSVPRGSLDFQPDGQAQFVIGLHRAGYAGGLTIEENFPDFARDAPVALGMFRRILDEHARTEAVG